MTLWDLYREGEELLSESGVDDAAIDARLLLLEAFSLTADRYLAMRMEKLSDDEPTRGKMALYREYINRRAQRVPLQRITGYTDFYGLTFSVKENVLIPRQDTETLVEQVLDDCAGTPDAVRSPGQIWCHDSLLDLCTGCGCIAVSLAEKGNFSRIAATDISADAIDAARGNAAAYHHYEIEFYQGDLFSALPRETPPFSVITVNPPYIPTGDIPTLQPEVRYGDPVLALDGSPDGLLFYRRIAAEAGPYLAPGGRIYMETGCGQGPAVCDIFKAAGFGPVRVIYDLSGKDRVVVADSPDSFVYSPGGR